MTLSDEIEEAKSNTSGNPDYDVITVGNVKNFIKELKESTSDIHCGSGCCFAGTEMRDIIDKFSGDKFI